MNDIIYNLKSRLGVCKYGADSTTDNFVSKYTTKYEVKNNSNLINSKAVDYLIPQMPSKFFKSTLVVGLNDNLKQLFTEKSSWAENLLMEVMWNSECKQDLVSSTKKEVFTVHIPVTPEGNFSLGNAEVIISNRTTEDDQDKVSINIHYDNCCVSIIVPLKYLLTSYSLPITQYHGYIHSMTVDEKNTLRDTKNSGNKITHEYFVEQATRYQYIGITGRGWLVRFKEHINGIAQGQSKKKYYKYFKNKLACPELVTNMSFELISVGRSYQEIMEWEEMAVDYKSNAITLNVLPGGFKGLKLLHRLGFLSNVDNATEQEVCKATNDYIRANPRITTIGNNFNYSSVFKREATLNSVEEVDEIRWLFFRGLSRKEIASFVDRPYDQICRVVSEKTYKENIIRSEDHNG